MFAAALASVVLASSIAMPAVSQNPWSVNNWAALNAEYVQCAETAVSSFSYYVCTSSAYNKAITSTVKA